MTIIAASEVYTFYDAKQQQAKLSLYLGADTTTAASALADGNFIALDLAALTNSSTVAGGVVRSKGPFTTAPEPVAAGGTGVYQNVADKAVFAFTDSGGQLHRYEIPCPKTSIFLADQETVDFTNTAVKQFVADMTGSAFGGTSPQTLAAVRSKQNNPLTAAVGGYRHRGKTPRKFNIYTRNPTLSGQGE